MGKCRFCGNELKYTFADLGTTPLANSYVPMDKAESGEMTYPLHLYVCDRCFLVQMKEMETPEHLFENYAYFSSYSTTWLEHAAHYVDFMMDHYEVDKNTQVIEIASNDGYLLQYFKNRGVPVLGIEPAENVADVAEKERGIPTIREFFGAELAMNLRRKGTSADLLLAHNVLQHVPDINDFVEGLSILLHEKGIMTLQFHYLLSMIQKNEFDTIYHEHFSYLSLTTVQKILSAHGLYVFDAREFPEHGGSIRIFACHEKNKKYHETENVSRILDKEYRAGLQQIPTYLDFSNRASEIKRDLLELLIGLKREGKKIAAYGAAAKGNTLLNYCGIRQDFIDYVADRSPHKQGTLLPGSRIPVCSPEAIEDSKPDYLLILPWNLKEEIMGQLDRSKEWGMKYIIPIPKVTILE